VGQWLFGIKRQREMISQKATKRTKWKKAFVNFVPFCSRIRPQVVQPQPFLTSAPLFIILHAVWVDMRRSNIILASGLTVVAAAVIGVDFLWPDQGLPQSQTLPDGSVAFWTVGRTVWRTLPRSQTLPDGSVLKVIAVSFGTNHSYQEVGPKGWQLAIGKRLPYGMAARLGWRFDTKRLGWVSNPYAPFRSVIFTTREGPGSSAIDKIAVVVVDEKSNNQSRNHGGFNVTRMDQTSTHYHQLKIWPISGYPRAIKTPVVQFFWEKGDGTADVPIMQFHIAQPRTP
jgi:hypothetical protein